MEMRIPKQLQHQEFRFYLIGENSKIPLEKNWNSTNNYQFNNQILSNHRGNYGVACGYGNLIVLDFDDVDYYNLICERLPPTFTVRTAKKKLPHLYYTLIGTMIQKKGIDINDKRVMDIQAARSGIVGPGSSIDRAYYNIENPRQIIDIDLMYLETMFKFKGHEKKEEFKGTITNHPELVRNVATALHKLGLKRTRDLHFHCPFHTSQGGDCLVVLPTGRLYCFHEQRTWSSLDDFIIEYFYFKETIKAPPHKFRLGDVDET